MFLLSAQKIFSTRCSVSENLGEFRFFLGFFRGVPD